MQSSIESSHEVTPQVMCTRNFPELGLANGSRGIVTAMDGQGISFKKLSGNVVYVKMFDVRERERALRSLFSQSVPAGPV
jgi:hypothetical protein